MDTCLEKIELSLHNWEWTVNMLESDLAYTFLKRDTDDPRLLNLDFCFERLARAGFKASLVEQELDHFVTFLNPEFLQLLVYDTLTQDAEMTMLNLMFGELDPNREIDEVEGRPPLMMNDISNNIMDICKELRKIPPMIRQRLLTPLTLETCFACNHSTNQDLMTMAELIRQLQKSLVSLMLKVQDITATH